MPSLSYYLIVSRALIAKSSFIGLQRQKQFLFLDATLLNYLICITPSSLRSSAPVVSRLARHYSLRIGCGADRLNHIYLLYLLNLRRKF